MMPPFFLPRIRFNHFFGVGSLSIVFGRKFFDEFI